MPGPSLRRLMRWLRKEFPVEPGMGRVRRVNCSDDLDGYTTRSGMVYLNRNMDESTAKETAIHEWTHLRVGWKIKEHTQEFWKELGRISNAYDTWRETL